MQRRDWLKGVAAASMGAAVPAVAATGPARGARAPLPTDPATRLAHYVRLRGSSGTETVWRPYEADLFLVQDGEIGVPLCGVIGIQKSHWTRGDDGGVATYTHRDYDVGVYVDYETRAPLQTWRNPITGRDVAAQPFRGGPSGTTHRVDVVSRDIYSNAAEGRWTVIGPQVSHTVVKTAEIRNPVTPEAYPLVSTGKSLKISMSTTYMGSRADLDDATQTSPPSTMVWTDLTPYSPWMEMGPVRGQELWRMVGNKAAGPDDLPAELVERIEAVVPGYVTRDAVWDGPNISGYQEYLRTHRPAG